MKILIYGYHPATPTGLGYITGLLMSTLIKFNHKVSVLAYQGGNTEVQQIQGVSNFDAKYLEKYIAMIRDTDTDLLISVGDLWACEPVWEITAKTGKPWVAYTSCEGINYPNHVRISSNEILNLKRAIELISCIWAYDERSANIFEKKFKCNVEILPHAIDYESVQKAPKFELKKSLGLRQTDKLALIIADNILRKGLDLFIEWLTLEQNSDWYGYIHAPEFRDTGFDLEELRNIYSEKLKNRLFLKRDLFKIIHRDFLTKQEIYGMYKDCDLYLHPHRAEGFGLTVLEALVANANVRATDFGGPHNYLPNDCKIDFRKQIYMQHGGVGYLGVEPILSNINTDKFIYKLSDKYNIYNFINNVKSLIEIEYSPKIWRNI